MKDNFTEQQREIVARKMGFDGPMQNFGEFLMSSPATANQYATVANKLASKQPGFAVGGAVQQRESATAIIKAYASKYYDKPDQILSLMTMMLKSGNALLLQEKNTVFFIDKHMPRIVAIIMATTESGDALNSSIEVLIDKVRKSGITMAYGIKENEDLKQAFAQRNLQVLPSDVPDYAWRVVIK
jgi:hypothetical protein